MYNGYVEDILSFKDYTVSYLEEIFTANDLAKAYYIDYSLYYDKDYQCWACDTPRLLDINKNELPISSDEIYRDGELLSTSYYDDMFYFLSENPIVRLKY